MIIIQFLENLFHDSFTEEDRLCAYTKLLTILIDCIHLLVIQVDDLPVTTYQRRFLFLEIFGIHTPCYFLFTGHSGNDKMNIPEIPCKGSKFYRNYVSLP